MPSLLVTSSPSRIPCFFLGGQTFARGGLLSVVGDAPQRAGLLYIKTPNNKTLHPCTTCNVTQSQAADEQGGDLGKRDYNIVQHRRTRSQVLECRERLREAGIGSQTAAQLSKRLGVVEPVIPEQESVLYGLVSLHQPMESCTVELLHQNHLVRSQPEHSCWSNDSGGYSKRMRNVLLTPR